MKGLIYTTPMPTLAATTEYMKLSVSERIQLVEDIWDSIKRGQACIIALLISPKRFASTTLEDFALVGVRLALLHYLNKKSGHGGRS